MFLPLLPCYQQSRRYQLSPGRCHCCDAFCSRLFLNKPFHVVLSSAGRRLLLSCFLYCFAAFPASRLRNALRAMKQGTRLPWGISFGGGEVRMGMF